MTINPGNLTLSQLKSVYRPGKSAPVEVVLKAKDKKIAELTAIIQQRPQPLTLTRDQEKRKARILKDYANTVKKIHDLTISLCALCWFPPVAIGLGIALGVASKKLIRLQATKDILPMILQLDESKPADKKKIETLINKQALKIN